jgi:hypothetical protein
MPETTAPTRTVGQFDENVGKPTRAYFEDKAARQLSRDLYGGTEAMRAAGDTYLPKEKAETDAEYAKRLKRTFLRPYFSDAVRNLAGKVFEQPVKAKDDVPTEIQGTPETESLLDNIDNSGNNLQQFGLEVFQDGLVDGISFILVDATAPPEGTEVGERMTEDQIKALGLRPYWIRVTADQLIGIRDHNGQRLLAARIAGESCEADGEFGEKVEKWVRVLIAGDEAAGIRASWSIWVESTSNDRKGWALKSMGFYPALFDIPLHPFYAKRKDFFRGAPTLGPMAEMCLQEYQKRSDFDRKTHVALVPILHRICTEAEANAQTEIGVARLMYTQMPEGKAEWIETKGDGVMKLALEELEGLGHAIRRAGLQPLLDKDVTAKTATEVNTHSRDANCALARMAQSFRDTLAAAALDTARMLGGDTGGTFDVNEKFALNALETPQVLTALRDARKVGDISWETMLTEMHRLAAFGETWSLDIEKERLTAEGKEPWKAAPEGDDAANAVLG